MTTKCIKNEKCFCESCVAKNYPLIAAKHANCYLASLDVAYRYSMEKDMLNDH